MSEKYSLLSGPNARINVLDPATNEVSVAREDSGRANGLYWTPNDAMIACEGGNRRVTWQLPGGPIKVLADKFEDKKLNSPNDLVLDGIGGLYFTDPRYGDRSDMEMEVEAVYYLNQNVFYTSDLQIVHYAQPELCPLGLLYPHPENLLVP